MRPDRMALYRDSWERIQAFAAAILIYAAVDAGAAVADKLRDRVKSLALVSGLLCRR